MKIIINEYNYPVFYQVDDLKDFDENANLDDFKELNLKNLCFVNENYDLYHIELNKLDKLYKYNKEDKDIILLISNKKYYITNWGRKIMNIIDISIDDYDIEMINKIRMNNIIHFTTQF